MAITIMILCIFLFVVLNIITLQVGYLIGKKHYQETREDQYWDMCRQIAQYDDELHKARDTTVQSKKLLNSIYGLSVGIGWDKRYIAHHKFKHNLTMTPEEMKLVDEDEKEDKWTDEDCDGIGCWECKYFRQDKNVHNPYDEKDAYYCSHKKLYISGNMSRPDYMDMRYTDFDKLGCKEEE